MEKDTTRRRLLQGLAVSAFGGTAGCAAGSLGGQSSTQTENSSNKSDTTDTASGSYSVSMVPMGKVTFKEVPTKWLAGSYDWADMGIALGRDQPAGTWNDSKILQSYYEEIPGVSIDSSEIIVLTNASPEVFYEIAADVHVIDPNLILDYSKSYDQEKLKRIKKNVAPFFGNTIYTSRHSWHDYRHYMLYEAFRKLAQVFQRQERYKMFAKLHREVQQTIETNLPTGKHPAVALLWPEPLDKPEEYIHYVIGKGTSTKHLRDLKARDALAEAGLEGTYAGGATIDIETLLEIDPDILLLRGYELKTEKQFQNTIVEYLKNHPVARELSAVKKGNVFRAGSLGQGPITNLILTERVANQIYPNAFDGVNLYDPQRVSDIVHGRF
ncbi:ABC transporter substrate-binding protein [Halococcus sediminicola]|uniref:ABC transporter substrate-binding protein n=1 Tax=Halococcus sediminicola TaxID=1264579 RepID=UPI000AD9A5D2|nr:ABC transporter substrate-binding protein [Halococcus sediminicola]